MATIECEVITERKAYKIHPEKTSELPLNYSQEEGLTLCEKRLGDCPYKEQREELFYTESDTGIVCRCNSNGRIPKTLEEIPLTL